MFQQQAYQEKPVTKKERLQQGSGTLKEYVLFNGFLFFEIIC